MASPVKNSQFQINQRSIQSPPKHMVSSTSGQNIIMSNSQLQLQNSQYPGGYYQQQQPQSYIVNQSPRNVQMQPIQPIVTYSPVKVVKQEIVQQPVYVQHVSLAPSWLKCCIWLLPFIFAILSLIAATFLIVYEKNRDDTMTNGYDVLSTVYDNLDALPINGIIANTVGGDCPSGYSVETLGYWPGLTDGCICEDDDAAHASTYCLANSECSDIDDSNSIPITAWTDGDDSQYCVRYVSEYEHTDDDGNCPDSMTLCSYSDSCVGASDDCPFNTITATSLTRRNLLDHIFSHKQSAQYSDIVLNGYTWTYSEENNGNTPIIGLDITSGSDDYPCWDSTESPAFESGLSYPFSKVTAEGCSATYGSLSDTYITVIDNELATDVIAANEDLQTFVDETPYYSDYIGASDTLTIYNENRISVSSADSCAINLSYFTKTAENQLEYNQIIFFLAIVVIFISSILILMTLYFLCTYNETPIPLPGQKHKHHTSLLFITAILLAIFNILAGAAYYSFRYMNYGLQESYDYFSSLTANSCFHDDSINLAIAESSDYTSQAITYTATWIYCLLFGAIGFCFIALILLCYRKSLYPQDYINIPFKHYSDVEIESVVRQSDIIYK